MKKHTLWLSALLIAALPCFADQTIQQAEPVVTAAVLKTQLIDGQTVVTINKGERDGLRIGDEGSFGDTRVSFRINKVYKFRSTAVVDIRNTNIDLEQQIQFRPSGNDNTDNHSNG